MSEQPAIYNNGTVLAPEAVARQKLWEEIGMPMSPMYMEQADMDRLYRGRFTAINRGVLEEAQRAMRFVACPSCVVERNFGEITVTRFHTRVQDDVMNVFKAMARNFCFNCGHEEFWPLSRDPRAQANASELQLQEMLRRHRQNQYTNAAMVGQHNQQLAQGIGQAGLGQLLGMTQDERDALQRHYQKYIQAANSPPVLGKAAAKPHMTATELQARIDATMRAIPEWLKP